jgi:hypothetical protein
MAARTRRERFASPLVITLGTVGLAACGGSAKPPTELIANPPAIPMHEARWRVETTAPDQCTATPCDENGDCAADQAEPYPCIPGRPTVVILRNENEKTCAYNQAEPPPPMDCPPDLICNPPPPEWKPMEVRCPDAPNAP